MELSPEDKLLLYCARTEINKEIARKTKALLSLELDWGYIRKKAYQHGVASLLYYNLKRINQDNVAPEKVMEEFKEVYYFNSFRNVYLYGQLREILKILQNVNIQVIVLKGAALAELVYKNVALRPMVDIDLLVKEKDLTFIKEKFSQLGYRSRSTRADWGLLWRWRDYLPTYVKRNGAMVSSVDIHLGMDTLLNINSPEEGFNLSIVNRSILWETALPTKIAGVNTLTLAPESLLQHFSIHTIRHAYQGYPRLLWLCDIAEVLRCYQNRIDWKSVVQGSRSYKTEEFIYYSLSLVKKWLGAPVPLAVLNELKPVAVVTPTKEFCMRFIKGSQELRMPEKEVRHLLRFLKTKGIQNKIQSISRRFFQRKMKPHTGLSGSACFYYIIRFSRVVGMIVKVLHYLYLIKFRPKLYIRK